MSDNSQPENQAISNDWLDELSEALGDEYIVIAEPEIQRVKLSGVVVIPQGLIVLHARGWPGEIIPSTIGAWRQRDTDGNSVSYPNPSKDFHGAEQALRRFLHDEFPSLKITIVQLLVLTNPEAHIVGKPLIGNMLVIERGMLAQEINTLAADVPGEKLGMSVQEELANALVERRLSRNQKASTPFVFRSSSWLGGNNKAWTIDDIFKHISRNPDDGIYHMRNGTLEHWFTNQGATHMAKLVHEVANEAGRDPRAALENLVARSGIVKLPGIKVRPRRLDLGRVLAGVDCTDTVVIKSESRNGYVVGTLETSEPWLRVEPKQINAKETRVNVMVDTSKLAIQSKPYYGEITLNSAMLPHPMVIPVRMRIVAEPSSFVRLVVRPLIGAVFAGLVGALLGILMGTYGITPAFVKNLVPGWPAPYNWALLIGAFWMVWGIVRGYQQPLSMPIDIWFLRWLVGTLLWMIPFGLLALACVAIMSILPVTAGLVIPEFRNSIIIGALAVAIMPAVLDKGKDFSYRRSAVSDTLSSKRPIVVTLIMVAVIAALLAGLLYIPRLWNTPQVQTARTAASSWVTTQVNTALDTVDGWVEEYYLRRYDRRVKGSSATPMPAVSQPKNTSGEE